MDDNTRQLLVALMSGLFGLLTGVAVAAIGFRHTRDIENDRATREDGRRWLADRRQAYSRLLLAIDEHHHRIAERFNDPDADVIDEPTPGMLGSADAPYEDVLIIGQPGVRHAASELYGHMIVLDVLTRRPIEAVMLEHAIERREELMDLWQRLRRAIHEDLGIEPDLPDAEAISD